MRHTRSILSPLRGLVMPSVFGVIWSAQGAFADYSSGGTTTLRTPLVQTARQAERGQPPLPGLPPPVGSGANAPPLIQGDAGAPPGPPSGEADLTTGNRRFGSRPERVRVPVVNNGQLGRDQSLPYPQYREDGPSQKHVTEDGQIVSTGVATKTLTGLPGAGRPRYQPLRTPNSWQTMEDTSSPMPTVQVFCRMLVILGAVFATVLMIFAALGVILSHKAAGERVIGTAAGLILLFMGYSIYKVVMINAFRYPTDVRTSITKQPPPALQPLSPADTPVVPPAAARAAVRGAPRSNMPVAPFANANNP